MDWRLRASPLAQHLVNTQFRCRPKTVLHRPQDTVNMMPVALKLENGIHHVLQYFRPGYHTIFGNMPDQKYRRRTLFSKAQKAPLYTPLPAKHSPALIQYGRNARFVWNPQLPDQAVVPLFA